ncbi:MAG: PQQ-binding-like beta-propeller repeat protein [Luteitalea sp.]|nr:PQQ-binding-like beta-propeller repeat protein [Luteitalea sp.]
MACCSSTTAISCSRSAPRERRRRGLSSMGLVHVFQTRRIAPGRWVAVCTLVLWCSMWPATAQQESSRPDAWPQFRGNPQLTGVADELPPTIELLWTAEIGESVESSAAIVDGTVYVGAQPGVLAAVDLASGKVKWTYEASDLGVGESSPAVHDGVVYIGDLDGVLHAVDAATGKARWTFETEGEIKSSPVIADDHVLIGSYDGHLYGLGLDGQLAWKVRTEGPVHATAAIRDGVAHIAGCDTMLRGIRVADGKQLFTVSSGAYTGASAALEGSRAFYGTFENEVLAVDLDARKILWRYRHPERNFPFYSSAAIEGTTVFVGGRDKILHALDAATGKALWTFMTRARIDSSPVVSSGRVYVGSSDGRLYVVDAASGEKTWEFEAGAPISASPAIAAGRLVIGAQDGRLYCLGVKG